jgi:DNA-binding ferritin-like protein
MADPRSWVAVSRRGDQRLLTGLMEKHEKMAWMLRAFLAAESV